MGARSSCASRRTRRRRRRPPSARRYCHGQRRDAAPMRMGCLRGVRQGRHMRHARRHGRRRAARGMRRHRRVGAGQGRGAPHLFRAARPAAPRAGLGRHRRGRRDHGLGSQGPRPRDLGIHGFGPLGAARQGGHRARALRHLRRAQLGVRAAPHVHHRRHDHRALAQRHPRELRRPARRAHQPGRALPLQHRLRGGRQAHRLLHRADAPPHGRHRLYHVHDRGRLRHGRHARERPLRVPRPARHPPARAGQAPRGRRLDRGERDMRARHHGCELRPRDRARRDPAHLR